MAGLGFFAGGLADSLQQGLSQQQLNEYRQKELQIQQLGQQQAQQRFEMTRNDKFAEDLGNSIQQTVEQLQEAGHTPQEIMKVIQNPFERYQEFTTSIGRPGQAAAQLATWFAAPPKTQTIRAEAEAKETPSLQAERASMAKYRESIADPFGMNSGPGTGTVAPPGTGNAFKIGESGPMPGGSVQELPPGAPLPIAGGTQVAQATPTQNSGQGQQGDTYLSTLKPGIASAVKAVGDYDVDLNTMLTRIPGPQRAQFLSMVKQYNSDYKVANFQAMKSAYQRFLNPDSGVGKTLGSLNTLTSHLQTLQEAGSALKNKDWQSWNRIANTVLTEGGYSQVTSFDAVKKLVGDEIVKAVQGGAGGLGDRDEIQKTISSASSPAQLAGVIDHYNKLIAGRLVSLRKSYETDTGRKDFDKFLTPAAKKQFDLEQSGVTSANDQDWQPTAIPGVKIRQIQ